MSTGGDVGSAQALSHKREESGYLFARHVELLDDLVDAEILEVLDDRGHGQTGALEHPRAADLAGDALHSGALGSIERCHGLTSKLQLTGSRVGRHAGSPRAPEPLDLPQPCRHLVPTGENLGPPHLTLSFTITSIRCGGFVVAKRRGVGLLRVCNRIATGGGLWRDGYVA